MIEPLVYRILIVLLMFTFVAHRDYYNRKYPPSDSETTDKLGPSRGSAITGIIFALAFIATFIYVFFPNMISSGSIPFSAWVRWLGVGIAIAGFLLLEWSHRVLGSNWGDQPRITETQQLVQSGPYRRIRHPIYTSFLLILGSTLLITANWLVGGLWIGAVVSDGLLRIRYEEVAMLEKFGDDYLDYRNRTSLILPRFR